MTQKERVSAVDDESPKVVVTSPTRQALADLILQRNDSQGEPLGSTGIGSRHRERHITRPSFVTTPKQGQCTSFY